MTIITHFDLKVNSFYITFVLQIMRGDIMLKDKLRELRKSKGLTQFELADELGIPQSTLGNYESGRRLPKFPEDWVRIANYFEVSVDYLMDNTTLDTKNSDSPLYNLQQTYYLTDDETQVIKNYLSMSSQDRQSFARILRLMSKDLQSDT